MVLVVVVIMLMMTMVMMMMMMMMALMTVIRCWQWSQLQWLDESVNFTDQALEQYNTILKVSLTNHFHVKII